MSEQIILSYKEKERKISIPSNYTDLKESFLSAFEEDEKGTFSFSYKDAQKDEIMIEEEDEQFQEKISEILKINSVVHVEKIEDLEDLNNNSKNEFTIVTNEMKSGMIFKKPDKDIDVNELNKKLEEYEKENKKLLESNKIIEQEKEEIKKKSKELEMRNYKIQKKVKVLEDKIKNQENLEFDSEDLKNKYEGEMSQIKQQYLDEKKKREDLELKLKENHENSENINKIKDEIRNKDKKIKELKEKIEKNKENIKNKEEKIEEYEKKINNYEEDIKVYKSELEKSKLDIMNLKKNNEAKEGKKYLEVFLDKYYKEKAKEELGKIKETLNKKVSEEKEKLKTFYENKYKEKEKKMEEDLNQMSEMINKSNAYLSNIVQPSNKFEHKGIKCQKCMVEPIIGIRYQCSECKDYNLCEKCEEENSKENFHNKEHDFIKIRETKVTEKKDVEKNKLVREQMMEKLKLVKKKIYSYDCPNILNLTEFIYEGTEKANIKIILKNNGEIKWPKDKTKLIFDETSQIKGDDIILFPQEIGEENSYTAILTNLEDLKDGEYKAYLAFNVGGKNYGEKLTLMIKIKKKENKNELIDKYKDKINEFREFFNLSEDDYTDEKILAALQEHNFIFEDAFSSLFE